MTDTTLTGLGWSHHFAAQLAEAPEGLPARISAVARDRVTALSPEGELLLTTGSLPAGDYACGDWVLQDGTQVLRLLDRTTLVQRRAAGSETDRQLIAANVDTLGIVTSCNAEFSAARLERYLALAASAGCLPLVILTKPDLAEDPDAYARTARGLSPMAVTVTLDGRGAEAAELLAPWCGKGQTLALTGSSGVGKTSLTNTLTGRSDATQDVRGDTRGRHTTTARALLPTLAGGWLIDTPGMRELGLTDAAEGIAEVFSDLEDLAATCRFNDCAHETEPGCAVTEAIAAGKLDAGRLERWRKLLREDARTTETIADARARTRSLSRHQSAVQKGGRRGKGDRD